MYWRDDVRTLCEHRAHHNHSWQCTHRDSLLPRTLSGLDGSIFIFYHLLIASDQNMVEDKNYRWHRALVYVPRDLELHKLRKWTQDTCYNIICELIIIMLSKLKKWLARYIIYIMWANNIMLNKLIEKWTPETWYILCKLIIWCWVSLEYERRTHYIHYVSW